MPVAEVLPETLTARDLLADGDCTAACLLAFADDLCQCRCGGRYHGDLLEAVVPSALHGRDYPRRIQMAAEDKLAEIERLLAKPLGGAALRLRVAQVVWGCDARTAAGKLGMPTSTYYQVRDADASGDEPEGTRC